VSSADGYTLLPAVDHRKMKWLNGGGWTSEIIAWPHLNNWEWRLSVADIVQDGPFSIVPDVDRTIALIQGNGFALTAENRPMATITSRYEPFGFRGDEPINCSLLNGPVQDLNLMVRRSTPPRHLCFIEVTNTMELIDFELVVVLSGRPNLGDHHLSRLDAIRPDPASPAIVLSATCSEPATVAMIT
jgi:uncharacterized protein